MAVNSEFLWCAEHSAGLQEGKTCCFHVPEQRSRPLKTSVFTQVGSLRTVNVRKKEEGYLKKKRQERNQRMPSPF